MALTLFFSLWLSLPVFAASNPCSSAALFDDNPLKQALHLSHLQKYAAAHAKISNGYNLNCPEIPSRVALYDCEILGRMNRWDEAIAVADGKLQALLPWLSDHLKGGGKPEDTNGLDKLPSDELALLRCAADSRSELFNRNYASLSSERRKQLRDEVASLADLLTQANYSSDKIQRFTSRVSSREDDAVKRPWTTHWQVLLSYMTWYERSPYYSATQKYDAGSNVMGYCLGGAFSWQNGYYSLDAGGCYGVGTAQSQIDAADYDDSGSVQSFTAFFKAIRKLTESGSGFGLQAGIFNRTIKAQLDDGTPLSASSLDIELLAVGRLNFEPVFFDVKGGSILGQPSALWTLELGYQF